ncbi:MAG TPA: hypothetical protein VJ521_05400, partial [Acidobacteriota bacterium]|nr:hypothetical protein [Acidobacteriota bacterium]
GELYKRIDASYPTAFPIWYGGEIVASSKTGFHRMSEELLKLHRFLINAVESDQSYHFANGWSMFDGDELYCNFVYNKPLLPITEVGKYIKRIWSLPDLNNVEPQDLQRTIWHLPGEKNTGLMLLFDEALQPESRFWKLPLSEFTEYLGSYVGVPERKHTILPKPKTFGSRVANFLKPFKG